MNDTRFLLQRRPTQTGENWWSFISSQRQYISTASVLRHLEQTGQGVGAAQVQAVEQLQIEHPGLALQGAAALGAVALAGLVQIAVQGGGGLVHAVTQAAQQALDQIEDARVAGDDEQVGELLALGEIGHAALGVPVGKGEQGAVDAEEGLKIAGGLL